MQPVMLDTTKKAVKTQLHKNNINSYICRPSAGIFQADILNILGTIQFKNLTSQVSVL